MDAFNDMLQGEMQKIYITPAEAAKMTGISASTIRRAALDGELPFLRAGRRRGGAIRIPSVWTRSWRGVIRGRNKRAADLLTDILASLITASPAVRWRA